MKLMYISNDGDEWQFDGKLTEGLDGLMAMLGGAEREAFIKWKRTAPINTIHPSYVSSTSNPYLPTDDLITRWRTLVNQELYQAGVDTASMQYTSATSTPRPRERVQNVWDELANRITFDTSRELESIQLEDDGPAF